MTRWGLSSISTICFSSNRATCPARSNKRARRTSGRRLCGWARGGRVGFLSGREAFGRHHRQ
jgi:hypothetical protein